MITTLIVYLICAYIAMYIAATFMIGTTHKPGISTKLVGAAIFLFAPITFLLLMGWFLFCIVYNLITD
jgi:hypothetical protein